MTKFILILAGLVAASTQLTLAGPHGQRPSQAPGQSVQRAPARVERMQSAPVQRERMFSAPVQRGRVYAAPVQRERVFSAPVQRGRVYAAPVQRERVFSAPVQRGRVYAAPVQRGRVFSAPVRRGPMFVAPRERGTFVQVMPRSDELVFPSETIVRHVSFERFVPQRIVAVEPVSFVQPVVAASTVVTPWFVEPQAVVPMSYVYTGYAPAYVSYDTYVPAFTSYTSYTPFSSSPLGTLATLAAIALGGGDGAAMFAPQPVSYTTYVQPIAYEPAYVAPAYVAPVLNPYGNAQVQGVVLSQTGNSLIVMTPSLQPVIVDTGMAEQAGYVQGSVEPGQVVNAYGYFVGDQFVATALV